MAVVSIITPIYNRANLIKETAVSVFNQTNPNWEWIIVDDGSTDESFKIIQDLASRDGRVKVLQRERLPRGAATCRNIAIENSRGNYLLFLDSDDLLASFCIEQRLKAAQVNPEYDILIFPMLLFEKRPDDMRILWNIDSSMNDAIRIMIGDAICQTTGPLWKKKTILQLGGWDEDLLLWQDVELHLRAFMNNISVKKQMHLTPDIFIRLSDVSISRTGYNSLPKFKSRMKVFKDSLKLATIRGVLPDYKMGLKKMGFDLICSSIFNNHFKEAQDLIEYSEGYNLFSSNEKRKLMNYWWAKKIKLYKLPLLKSFATKPEIFAFENHVVTLGKVKYLPKINL